jgi:hypothetical protein
LYLQGIGQAWTGFTMEIKEAALKAELDAIYIFQTH